ncbi:MAG: hypothetical protein Q9224_006813 [Gallowayella concinna]
MMKQITWDDQWIGYDDEETTTMKKKWASGYCFGGTMIWSIDFKSGSGILHLNQKTGPVAEIMETQSAATGRMEDAVRRPVTVAVGLPSAVTVVNQDLAWEASRPPMAPVVLSMEVRSAARMPKAPAAHPVDSVGLATNTAAEAAYLVLATMQRSRMDPREMSTSILLSVTLATPMTINFPLYTTSLEVAWKSKSLITLPGGQVSTVTVYERETVKTTLTIPPMTTDQVDVWNVIITAGVTQSVITVTRSILPPPFTITDDPNPRSEQGVTHPPVHRTITPPPWPYVPPKPTSSKPGDIPHVSHTSKAPPGPTCKSGCGSKCKYFCVGPCLLNCVDPPGGFWDPIDPNPGFPPPPGPPPGSDDDDDGGEYHSKTFSLHLRSIMY